jgi:hypothetical protein
MPVLETIYNDIDKFLQKKERTECEFLKMCYLMFQRSKTASLCVAEAQKKGKDYLQCTESVRLEIAAATPSLKTIHERMFLVRGEPENGGPTVLEKYMRAGMESIANVYAKWKMYDNPAYLDAFVKEKFYNGEKNYPNTFGIDEMWIYSASQQQGLGYPDTSMEDFKPGEFRSIQDIVKEWKDNVSDHDIYGRGKKEGKKERISVQLPAYKLLTKPPNQYYDYHFQSFWLYLLDPVRKKKGWQYVEVPKAASLLKEAIPDIIKELQPDVPLSDQNRLNELLIGRLLLGQMAPVPPAYMHQEVLRPMINGPRNLAAWQQFEGITQQELAKVNWNEANLVTLTDQIKATKLNGPLRRIADNKFYILKQVRNASFLEYAPKE